MDKNRKPDFIITLLRISKIFNLYVLSGDKSLYGIFDVSRGEKTDSGIFIANKSKKDDYKNYVEIKLIYGDFDLNERGSKLNFEFKYHKPLQSFGEEKLEGLARMPLCNAERCSIEKVK